MGILDRLLGAPSLASVARDVTRELRALAVEDLSVDLAHSEMSFRLNGGQMRLFLGNLLHDLQHARRAERPAVLRRFLDGVLAPGASLPATYAEARPLLMPVVRSRGDMGIVELSTVAAAGPADTAFRPATKPLAGDLVIALVCDQPTAMAYVNEGELPKWGVTFDQALADALDNLRGLPEHGGWQQMAGGVWSGEWGDAYDSSRILLPDLIHRVGVRDPVVVVPFRNALMVTNAGNDTGLAVMAKVIEDNLAGNQRWLSFVPMRLTDAGLVPWQPTAATAAWTLLRVRADASVYEAQKSLLDAHHERTHTDIFVATCGALSWGGDGSATYGVWADGVDTLLPRTDLIAFAHKLPNGENATLLVPWDAACGVVGELMEATSECPERWRVRTFPDATQCEALAGLVFTR